MNIQDAGVQAKARSAKQQRTHQTHTEKLYRVRWPVPYIPPSAWSPAPAWPHSLHQCPQGIHAVSPKSSPAAAHGTTAPVFRYPGDHNFDLSEYMVVLDKPIGLTLAPDPTTGQIVVQGIKEESPAALSGMIQAGDVVKMCSAVFGEDMWQAVDIRRIRWAISNRTSKIKLVLERTHKPHVVPTWYSRGQVGRASQERDALQLPVSFTSAQQDDWSQDMAAPGKPLMCTFHTSIITAQAAPRSGNAAAARSMRLHVLREELSRARREADIELGPPAGGMAAAGSSGTTGPGNTPAAGSPANPMSGSSASSTSQSSSSSSSASARSSGTASAGKATGQEAVGPSGARTGGGSSSNSTGGNANPLGRLIESLAGGIAGSSASTSTIGTSAPASAPSPTVGPPLGPNGSSNNQRAARRGLAGAWDKKVTPVLPWLLVSSGRLDTRDLTQIASHRGLSAVLELGLTRAVLGVLAVRGSEAGGHGLSGGAGSLSEVNVSALLASAAAAAAAGGAGGAGGGGVPGAAAAPLALPSAPAVPPAALANRARPLESVIPGAVPTPELRHRCLVHAAAALQRLVVRRTYGSLHHSPPEACEVLLHCGEANMEGEVACLLAAWLHWYACMPLQEALLSAEIALGCAVEQGVVEGATEALVAAAEERSNKVVLTWRYGGLSASVAGDLVGSWSTRMPLMRCKNPLGCKGSVARGNFFLELAGLRPGVYYYKYIVDGTWAVDPAAPKVLDAGGNWNNVLEVQQRPPVSSSRERLALARWHARHLAWETKMGLRQ